MGLLEGPKAARILPEGYARGGSRPAAKVMEIILPSYLEGSQEGGDTSRTTCTLCFRENQFLQRKH